MSLDDPLINDSETIKYTSHYEKQKVSTQCLLLSISQALTFLLSFLVLLQYIFDHVVATSVHKFGVDFDVVLTYNKFCLYSSASNQICLHLDSNCVVQFAPLNINFEAFSNCRHFQSAKILFYIVSGTILSWALVWILLRFMKLVKFITSIQYIKLCTWIGMAISFIDIVLTITLFALLSTLPSSSTSQISSTGVNLVLQGVVGIVLLFNFFVNAAAVCKA